MRGSRARGRFVLIALLAVVAAGGCAGPGPRMFPPVAMQVRPAAEGLLERDYDLDRNGSADYREFISADGRLVAIGYLCGEDVLAERVDLAQVPESERRHLFMILDSIPFAMVQDARRHGRFAAFAEPARVIAPFPVMTDVCISDFFGVTPVPGVESLYYDGRRLTSGYGTYVEQQNVPWASSVDYVMWPIAHASTYLDPPPWYRHELRAIQRRFMGCTGNMVGYIVGTSALGARNGRDGHAEALIELDRFCQQLIHDTRGRVCISLMSDHGHYLQGVSQRISLADQLQQCGYRVAETLRKPGDVVVPEFGMVSYAAIHTHQPQRVAADVVSFEGVELAAYCEGESDQVVVLSRGGRAIISRNSDKYRYACVQGDPLELRPIWEQLQAAGQVDAEGYVDDRVLFEATVTHAYPDAVHRLWRAFHGLVVNTPDVLVSIQNGFHCGSAFQNRMIDLIGVHGSLRPQSSSGFAMSMAGALPEVVRMQNLMSAFQQQHVPIHARSGE